eukprot:scaffold51_cov125-Skeletonema_dohrnii-CCMP3373.AAC.4
MQYHAMPPSAMVFLIIFSRDFEFEATVGSGQCPVDRPRPSIVPPRSLVPVVPAVGSHLASDTKDPKPSKI